MTTDDVLPQMAEARERFMTLVAEIRPELHRYCARMTGSVFDGEDVVQETLAKGLFALSQMAEPPPLRPWLFRIAHNTAMDFVRRYERRHVDLVPEIPELAGPPEMSPDPMIVEAAIATFMTLPPVQRSAFVLKDVLDHSLEETAETMGTTVQAVKAALVRARANVASSSSSPATVPPDELKNLRRYANLFNARDWDGLRALLGEEARLDVVSRHQRRGKASGVYFTQYEKLAAAEGLRIEVGLVDGVPVLAFFKADSTRAAYFARLAWEGDHLVSIRDFRHVPYIGEEASFTKLG